MVARRAGALVALVFAASIVIAAPAASALSKTARDASRTGPVSDVAGSQPDIKTPKPVPFGLGGLNHDGPFGHLPPVQQNMELVGELNLIHPDTGQPVLPGQIADVSVHKGYAYLNSWDNAECEGGGTFVVDIRNPAAPKQVAFIDAVDPFYHGEGAHVISVSTPQFTGDLLAVNDEPYGSNVADDDCAPADLSIGGFDLYNVTDPTHPVALVQGAGDFTPESSLEVDPDEEFGNSYHSVFVWQDGPRAYLVASDNTELADIDIFDITDPTAPEFIRDFDPFDLPEFEQIVSGSAHGNNVFHHDVVVKRVGGQMRMLVSYWDAGYLQLDVDDPANPTYITDTNFDEPDPLVPGFDQPEGNAHESEYSHDSQFVLAADEDFSPYRGVTEITDGQFEGYEFSPVLSDAAPIEPGTQITGDTVYVGTACTGTVPAPPAGVTIAVVERGVCVDGFQEKAEAVQAAGYEMGIVMNNSFGLGGGRCDELINMAIDQPPVDVVDIPMLFVARSEGLRILGVFNEATYACTGAETETPADTDAPAVGTLGLGIQIAILFDGWGYTHLYDANTSEELDAFAIPEAIDERYADPDEFGVTSVHEFATDPATNLAYAAWYSGGMRVLRYSRADGLEQVGAYIHPRGNDIWGVEQFTDAAGNRLIAGSDRDFGLYIFKYTGPGAVLAKPSPPPPPPPPPPAAAPPRPSSFFVFGSMKRLIIANRRASATIKLPGAGKVTATLRAGIGRSVQALGKATGTATRAGNLRLTFRLSQAAASRLRRTLARRPTRRTSGTLSVTFTPTGGEKRTRNKSLSIGMR